MLPGGARSHPTWAGLICSPYSQNASKSRKAAGPHLSTRIEAHNLLAAAHPDAPVVNLAVVCITAGGNQAVALCMDDRAAVAGAGRADGPRSTRASRTTGKPPPMSCCTRSTRSSHLADEAALGRVAALCHLRLHAAEQRRSAHLRLAILAHGKQYCASAAPPSCGVHRDRAPAAVRSPGASGAASFLLLLFA